MLDRILTIQEIRQKKESVLRSEREVCLPLLTDFSLIPVIYKMFKRYMKKRDCSSCHELVSQRKKFIFVVLYYFAPGSIVGDKMPNGLREKIAEALGVKRHSLISIYCKDLIFLIQHYKDFRTDIERVIQFVCNELKLNITYGK